MILITVNGNYGPCNISLKELKEKYDITGYIVNKGMRKNADISLTGMKRNLIKALEDVWGMNTRLSADCLINFEDRVKLGIDKLENN